MVERIRQLLADAKVLAVPVGTLGEGDDLYEAGLTSFGSVQLMIALEEAFDLEFPERMLTRRTFSSIGAIARSVDELAGEKV